MPLVSPFAQDPLIDGRQSERAMMVRRGVQRMMLNLRVSMLPEMPLDSGRRADLVCLSEKGEISIVEIKTSIQDFRVDQKWPIYRLHCDRLYFATHPGVPTEIFPQEFGLILTDGYDAEILREAPVERLAPATRKAMTLKFARLSANRLLQAEWAANPAATMD
ncbi:MmcB family DNA repair protein [Jiella pelagia]|uniref:MmcB family DNA repair protein n=1 Tax=Jiella pelagia TaxID=2986949 RepID=A0ABY7C4V3_9HYPH|nr:MmcB family DNA repair protein [Jiella pelagia]WAP70857.1 MmcB family DNA repair protein [Jiella pelagia]